MPTMCLAYPHRKKLLFHSLKPPGNMPWKWGRVEKVRDFLTEEVNHIH